jgi:hypothetical protein
MAGGCQSIAAHCCSIRPGVVPTSQNCALSFPADFSQSFRHRHDLHSSGFFTLGPMKSRQLKYLGIGIV